ncbi:protein of unknown function [Myroides marinus]|uniref:DUF4270 domain-containing protein n=1 Tax=Myroides marinus TaxID=703342 RepID=A0A1H6S1U6_9FLAO|nr:DUF4270 family protein [Myroides marinus]SEI60666.1 protein of unknown function [Myroides marinus]
MNHKKILKGISLVVGLVALQACESDFTSTGNDLIGGGAFEIVPHTVKDLKAYNKSYGVVDGSRLNEVPFGYLDNGLFGATSSNLVLQLVNQTSTISEITDKVKVDSVYVYIPYYSQFDKVEDKVTKYKLKNVYGEGLIDLKVYQNGYYLMDVDLSDGSTSKFFTNKNSDFEQNKVGDVLNKKRSFFFDNKEIVIYKKDKDGAPIKDPKTGENLVKERLTPGAWLDLDEAHFTKFMKDNKSKLTTGSGFNEAFKGLYFETNQGVNGGTGSVGLLDVTKGKMVIIYHDDVTTKDKDGKETVTNERKEISIPFGNNSLGSKKFTVNTYKSQKDAVYQSAVAKANTMQGDESILLRGGEGSIAIIELLRDNDFAELKAIKESEGLLNDAYLTIFVDKEKMSGQPIPERLYLYDYDNSIAITDFANDAVSSAQYIKQGYNGIFVKEDTEKGKQGYYYKFKITDHIRGLLKSKNTVSPRLALTVANNFAVAGYTNQKLQTEITNTPTNVTVIPSFSVSAPIGVALYGTNAPEGKKMKLEIYYTKAKK